jgi:response regulator RpfG family c-di-GMP phosphodiesterase
MNALAVALSQLEAERIHLSSKLAKINDALAALKTNGVRRKRRMSPAAIARIRAAQKARWAKWRKAK